MDDLISEFITESTESLGTLDSELVKLEQNPNDSVILGNIFRMMHTIKGTCGFLGLPRLESVAHAGENVLGKIRDKELEATPQAITLILESLDTIKGLIDYLGEKGEEQAGDDSELINRLNHYAETGQVSGAAPAAAKPAEAPAATADVPAANADEAFPHFMGEDDPALKAAMDKILADEAAAKTAGSHPAATAPATPADEAFPHFKGEDDPAIKEAIEKMMVEEAAAKATPTASAQPVAKANGLHVETAPAKAKAPPSAKAKETAETPSGEAKEGAGANQSIRVNIDVLETLMQMVSELVLTRNQLMQIVRTKEDKDFLTPLQQLSHITTELQDGVMKTRMQPIGNAWSKFPRLIRDLSLELGKKIDLKMNGAETELDRQLLEVIKDPLTHMVRNSCDHGLETPADRLLAGKPETGTVILSAYHEGGHIIIEIKDDGRGINIDRVKAKAIANGMATEATLETMTEKQIAQFVFHPGFSTAEKVTSVSGRGVGMDVVKTNIEKIGGTIDLDSVWGKGSQVSIKIPLTLAIVSVLLVEVAGQKFAIPQINVLELVSVSANSELSVEMINNTPVMRLRNKLLPLAVLSNILGHNCDLTKMLSKEMYVAVCRVGGYDFGIIVERVYDTEEIVVKPVSSILKHIPVYSGNTILGDGSVIMILDPNGIAKQINNIDLAPQVDTAAIQKSQLESQALIGFLLFSTGKGAPKSVPLELVSRLEEIDVSQIEIAGDRPVIQYRGELMRLITLNDDFALPDSGMVDVVVFSYDKKVIGMVVKEIIDIVYTQFAIKLSSPELKQQGFLGSMVVAGKSTDVVDVGYFLADLVNDSVSSNETISHNRASECKVLLVEDSPFFRNLTVPFLASVGYKVTTADNAQDALEVLQKHNSKFDMIVTDIEMPGMDGFEFATLCRQSPQTGHIPIIAYTASVSEAVLKRSRSVGVNDCIVKTDRTGLLESVSRWLMGDIPNVRH